MKYGVDKSGKCILDFDGFHKNLASLNGYICKELLSFSNIFEVNGFEIQKFDMTVDAKVCSIRLKGFDKNGAFVDYLLFYYATESVDINHIRASATKCISTIFTSGIIFHEIQPLTDNLFNHEFLFRSEYILSIKASHFYFIRYKTDTSNSCAYDNYHKGVEHLRKKNLTEARKYLETSFSLQPHIATCVKLKKVCKLLGDIKSEDLWENLHNLLIVCTNNPSTNSENK